MKRISSQSGFVLFRCHSTVYLREREREKEQKYNTAKNRNEKRERMHEECTNMWRAKIKSIMGRNPIQPNSTHKFNQAQS